MFDFSTVVRSIRRRPRPDISLLLRVPTLAHADPRRLAELAPHTDRLRLPRGRTVVRAGATARELIVVLAGEAAVLHADGTWAVLGPGAEIGGCELLGHERHAATVVATSALDVVVVNGPAVRWAYAEGIARLAPTTGSSLPARRPHARPTPRPPFGSRADPEEDHTMHVGDTARRTRTVTARDIELFTEMTGDRNPLHYDEALARRSRFGGIIVQGGVTSGLLNAVVAQDLPGPGTVFLHTDWRFLAPVRPGDRITAEVEVIGLRDDKPIITLRTTVSDQDGRVVLDGRAVTWREPLGVEP